MAYREFGINPETKYPIEKRLYPNGVERNAMMLKLPTGDKGTAKWERDIADPRIEWVVTYFDGKEVDRRQFTMPKAKEQMKKIIPQSLPASRAVAVWWDVQPGEDISSKQIALITGVVSDNTAPRVESDGIDAMTLADLLTQAGMKGLKGPDGKSMNNKTPIHVVRDCLRNAMAARNKPKEEALEVAASK